MTERYFLDTSDAGVGGRFPLSPDESHHLLRVMRGTVGTPLALFNGRGDEWNGVVVATSRHEAVVELTAVLPSIGARSPRLTIVSALPKGDRQKWLVEKLTELGCHRLVPLRSARSELDATASVVARLRRQILEAAKQCQRCLLMELTDEATFDDLVAENSDSKDSATLRLIAHPPSDTACGQQRLRHFFNFTPCEWRDVRVIIGPAGGLTTDEVELAIAHGWRPLDLGTTRLRTETAAIAVAARIDEWATDAAFG